MRNIITLLSLLFCVAGYSQSANGLFDNLRVINSFRIGAPNSQKVTGFDTEISGASAHAKIPTSKAVWDLIQGECIYTAGTGIAISGGNVISNTGDLSNTNELQTLSIAGSNLSLSNGGGTVSIPGDNLGNHTATTTLDMAGNNVTNPNIISKTVSGVSTASIEWDVSNYLRIKNKIPVGVGEADFKILPGGLQTVLSAPNKTANFSFGTDGFNIYGTKTSGETFQFDASYNGMSVNGVDDFGNSALFYCTPIELSLDNTLPGISRTRIFSRNQLTHVPELTFSTYDAVVGSTKFFTMTGDTIFATVNDKDNTFFSVGKNNVTLGNTTSGKNLVVYDQRDAVNYMRYTVDKSAEILLDDLAIPNVGAIKTLAYSNSGVATLSDGTAYVDYPNITADSRIFLTCRKVIIAQGILSADPDDYEIGTGFRIRSSTEADNSTVNWFIVK